MAVKKCPKMQLIAMVTRAGRRRPPWTSSPAQVDGDHGQQVSSEASLNTPQFAAYAFRTRGPRIQHMILTYDGFSDLFTALSDLDLMIPAH